MRPVIIAMVIAASLITALCIIRVTRQHEVLRIGYQLERQAEDVRQLKEVKRRLEVECATLSAPDRIRRLASQLGMTTVAPDKIRIVDVRAQKQIAAMQVSR